MAATKGGHAQVLQIIELAGQPQKIAHAVSRAVAECAHVELINHHVLIPRRIALGRDKLRRFGNFRG